MKTFLLNLSIPLLAFTLLLTVAIVNAIQSTAPTNASRQTESTPPPAASEPVQIARHG